VPDRNIKCVDCNNDFVFTEREQEWYREKGLSHEPRRCKTCRTNRKSSGPSSGSRSSGDGGGGSGYGDHGGGYGGHDGGGGGGDRPRRGPSRNREMFKVPCATCGKETEVPFKPDPSRPVYCRDCFVARGKKR
jgi:CxxC-x17-CxxC domain-containing protein